ncbi:S9 family peptidase [Sinimarinibacterium sp. CAU 1509]|uniref:alpha/beta hydrolase family protein n=1 Tax=Sinimarinibacterium sp. CAU 1509 TaxID=2562283 RepID=UPI0010AC98F3|nr:S9 family peptidase [Sinimarinibacterium sp. CAU 1509]TJY60010.1 S9 family peptidase [Sinimarinibacterium sp. CAU 1509]
MKLAIAFCVAVCLTPCLAAPPSVRDFARHAEFGKAKLSPDGTLLAATVPRGDETHVAVIRLADMKIIGSLRAPDHEHAADLWWVSDERIVIAIGSSAGPLEQPGLTGELVASNADGSAKRYLYGYRGQSATGAGSGSIEYGWGWMLHPMIDNKDDIWIKTVRSTNPYLGGTLSYAHRLNVYTSRRDNGVAAPLPGSADFLVDDAGTLKFAVIGDEKTLFDRTFAYESVERKWREIGTPRKGRSLIPIAADSVTGAAYFKARDRSNRYCLESMNSQSGELSPLSCDNVADLDSVLLSADRKQPLAARYEPGKPVTDWINPEHADAELIRALAQSFPDQEVSPVSWSRNADRLLFLVDSDRNPGELYLYDRKVNKAQFVYAYRSWINPSQMGERRPISFKSRDGATIHGYLTLPPGRTEKQLPLVVNPHGGPFGIRDGWQWESDPQFLATQGYAVLQVNFRGSAGYGSKHYEDGRGHWGTTMIDDITDGVHYLTESGVVDGSRICIYGGSYGGYASLMSAVREPDLYRCVIGYAGVYDLPALKRNSDIRRSKMGRNYMNQYIGDDPDELEAQSPINHLEALKAPVFIVHGELDERAPFDQAKLLRKAMDKRKLPYEWMVKSNEGHGFWNEDHREELYTKMLAFLREHIGAGAPMSD